MVGMVIGPVVRMLEITLPEGCPRIPTEINTGHLAAATATAAHEGTWEKAAFEKNRPP